MNGLTAREAEQILKKDGPNEIPDKKQSALKKVTQQILSPISLMLFLASGLSYYTHKVFDAGFILSLLFINIGISFWQEKKADNAISKLNQKLSLNVKVLRDNSWKSIDSKQIVKGDIIELNIGNIIPADGKIIEAKNISINESALTGESLPKEKKVGDEVYSGSFLNTGQLKILVTATGPRTYFGKTLFSVDRSRNKSILESDILTISKFLSGLAVIAVVLLTITFFFEKVNIADVLTLDLSLVIAGIPISLPTVMTLIIELGVVALATKDVIVRRLSALEDLANVNLLLTDKTGTLTQNKITVHEIKGFKNYHMNDVLTLAHFASINDKDNSLNKAILEKPLPYRDPDTHYKVVDFIPADSVRKRSSVVLQNKQGKILVSVGAPQVIESLCSIDVSLKDKYNTDVKNYAKAGYRTLSVAVNRHSLDEKKMEIVGVIALSDTLRTDTKEVIRFLRENKISVVMLTGDNKAIAKDIINQLDFPNENVVAKSEFNLMHLQKPVSELFKQIGAFSEILPDDKYKIVDLAKSKFIVAVTGDGVNDIPAIKDANVGIAVKNAVDALKSTADIVLISEGISVIKDAIIESRKIFARLYSYSVYRISESLRLIATITILGLAIRQYPLTPLQLILLALLNDIPIISLAFDRVKLANSPAKVNTKERFILSSIFGISGVFESLSFFVILFFFVHLKWEYIQTIFFLQLTISGHLLIYVARTKERWFKFLPSKEVIFATLGTQTLATILALTGFMMSAPISPFWAVVIWAWSFLWMQIEEQAKLISYKVMK